MSGSKSGSCVAKCAIWAFRLVLVLSIMTGVNVSSHAGTTLDLASSTTAQLLTIGTASLPTWAAVLSAVAAMVLLFWAGFSVFVIWGMLFQVATADTEGRADGGTAGGIWNGELPRADELPREGD